MPSPDEQVMKQLERFDQGKDLEALREAGRKVASLPNTAGAGAGGPAGGKSKLVLWLTTLDRIDRKLDRAFDIDDPPSMTSEPPEELGLPAGVDPSAIQDPAARQKYESVMEADRRKREDYAFQKKLHKINDDLTSGFEKFIADDCRKPDKEKEIRDAVNSVLSDKDRRNEILRMIDEYKKQNG